ncbi:PucR family transcriptional regulator [Ruicaihuangia caeni]|uniref:PucR family transcriptional regulator n=1 Tax=Ruicaihuangia caeni TaxID=3042517 RepID=UPI00338FC4F9
MSADLRTLLATQGLRLQPATELSSGQLARPLLWAHNSDLADPTPWLEPDGLLLTDGLQFAGPAPAEAQPYVERLVDCGVAALGFATQIVHDSIPPALIDACAEHRLPLIEVADRTPFMAIIRLVSDATDRDQREQLERSLRAQRSVARAALRPDGLAAILRELERNLGCWVALFDAAGDRLAFPAQLQVPATIDERVSAAVRRTLSKGRAAAARITIEDTEITIQTVGHHGSVRGALVVGTGTELDRAGVDLVESVIALASIALEQSRALDTARRTLRSGILELLLAGAIDVARSSVRPLWGELPAEPIRVARVSMGGQDAVGDPSGDALLATLELAAERNPGRLFFGERDGRTLVVCHADDTRWIEQLLSGHQAHSGFSAPAEWSRFSDALGEALLALRRSSAFHPAVRFDQLVDEGLLGMLEQSGARAVANRLLEPLDRHPDGAESIRESLVVWLSHNGAWDPSARALGVHRHTLRNRVDLASALLGLDLDAFAARAEVWNALQLTAPARE